MKNKITVKKVWTITMKTGTNSNYSHKSYTEPDEKTILEFIESAINNVGWIDKNIKINTSWEIEKINITKETS